MTSPRLPARVHARFSIMGIVTRPLHWFFKHSSPWEIGLDEAEVSRISLHHPPLAGRRAVHVSDLHLDRYHRRHDAVLDRIARLAPDWIFVTGDLLNIPSGVRPLFRFLAGLRSVAPVYLTLGNHDHASGVPVPTFSELADRHKLHLLINQAIFIPLRGGELCIVGLDDPCLHRADPHCIPRTRPGRFTLLLAHAPNVLDLLHEDHSTDFILTGHSHGGQWRIGRMTPWWLPYGCNGRVEGFHVRSGHRMYVNRGLGWSILPIRWNCLPEIACIDWTEDGLAGAPGRPPGVPSAS